MFIKAKYITYIWDIIEMKYLKNDYENNILLLTKFY